MGLSGSKLPESPELEPEVKQLPSSPAQVFRINDQLYHSWALESLHIPRCHFRINPSKVISHYFTSPELEQVALPLYQTLWEQYCSAPCPPMKMVIAPDVVIIKSGSRIPLENLVQDKSYEGKGDFTIKFELRYCDQGRPDHFDPLRVKVAIYATHLILTTATPLHLLEMMTPEAKVCSICTESISSDPHLTPCFHLFHQGCVEKLGKCPICRFLLDGK